MASILALASHEYGTWPSGKRLRFPKVRFLMQLGYSICEPATGALLQVLTLRHFLLVTDAADANILQRRIRGRPLRKVSSAEAHMPDHVAEYFGAHVASYFHFYNTLTRCSDERSGPGRVALVQNNKLTKPSSS